MKPPKEIFEKVKADGADAQINQLVSAAHLLFSLGYSFFDDADTLLHRYNLRHGELKQQTNMMYKAYDRYHAIVGELITNNDRWHDFGEDFDELKPRIAEMLGVNLEWEPLKNKEDNEQTINN